MLSKIDLSDFLEINNSLYRRDSSERAHVNGHDGFWGTGIVSAFLGRDFVEQQD